MTDPATDRPRSGWDLVTSRPLTDEQRRRAEEMARVEAEHRTGKGKGKGKGKRKAKGGKADAQA